MVPLTGWDRCSDPSPKAQWITHTTWNSSPGQRESSSIQKHAGWGKCPGCQRLSPWSLLQAKQIFEFLLTAPSKCSVPRYPRWLWAATVLIMSSAALLALHIWPEALLALRRISEDSRTSPQAQIQLLKSWSKALDACSDQPNAITRVVKSDHRRCWLGSWWATSLIRKQQDLNLQSSHQHPQKIAEISGVSGCWKH